MVSGIALADLFLMLHLPGVRMRTQRGKCPIIPLLASWLCLQSCLHAAFYGTGGESSLPETDRLFGGDSVVELTIEVDGAGMEILRANSSNRYNSPNRPNALATVREGTNIYRRVAVHLKGSAGSFRGLDDKPSFTLHFSAEESGQRFHGLEKISLNNSVQDATYMCEFLARRMFNATSVPAPRAGHASVTLNGQALGLYVLLEGWNKQFLKRHFANPRGNFYEGAFRDDITAPLEVKSGADPENHSDLDALIQAARAPGLDSRFAALERVLDVDRFATFLALEVLLNHWDGYSLHVNNYRIFHDRSSGKLIFMPHGMDQLFGIRGRESNPEVLPAMTGLAARAFMETRAGRRLYLERMAQLQTNAFDVAACQAVMDKLEHSLRPKLGSPSALAAFDARVAVLRRRVEERHSEIGQQLAEMRMPRFDPRGEVSLANLNFRSLFREPYSQRRGRFQQDFEGQNVGRTSRPWRAVILLDAGRYRLQARVRTRIDERALTANVVNLRSSEGRSLQHKDQGNGWGILQHDFTLQDRNYVDLIYEFAAADGFDALDKSSLRLIRLPDADDSPRAPTGTRPVPR